MIDLLDQVLNLGLDQGALRVFLDKERSAWHGKNLSDLIHVYFHSEGAAEIARVDARIAAHNQAILEDAEAQYQLCVEDVEKNHEAAVGKSKAEFKACTERVGSLHAEMKRMRHEEQDVLASIWRNLEAQYREAIHEAEVIFITYCQGLIADASDSEIPEEDTVRAWSAAARAVVQDHKERSAEWQAVKAQIECWDDVPEAFELRPDLRLVRASMAQNVESSRGLQSEAEAAQAALDSVCRTLGRIKYTYAEDLGRIEKRWQEKLDTYAKAVEDVRILGEC
jgi:hypothetical protein